MYEKKQNNFKTPDLTQLQEVIIDVRTKIYIALGADPEEARSRYLTRVAAKNKVHFSTRKPVVS
jgi:hypothetical protein